MVNTKKNIQNQSGQKKLDFVESNSTKKNQVD